MYDYFFQFATEQDAITASSCAKQLGDYYTVEGSTVQQWRWNQDFVLPNVKAWRISQDSSLGHAYLPNWYAVVARTSVVQGYLNSTGLAFCLDRNGPPYIVKSNISSTVLQDLNVQPIFAGSHYPVGSGIPSTSVVPSSVTST